MMGKWIDSILGWLADMVIPLLLLLPESPIQKFNLEGDLEQFGTVLSWINYFLPLDAAAGIMTGYVAAVLIWYGVRWFLRIAKYIQ